MAMKVEIKNRFTGAMIHCGEYEDVSACLIGALEARADLSGADLSGAYLSGATLAGANLAGAYLAGAYSDATYRRFTDAPCPPELSGGTTVGAGQAPGAPGVPGSLSPANCDISGHRLPGVSKWSLSFGAEATAPTSFLGEEGEVFLAYDGSYRSTFSSNPTPSAYTWVDGYLLSNFRAGFRAENGIQAYLWVRNAFAEDYFEQLAVPSGNTGLIVGQPGDPRTYGFTLSHSF